MSFDYPTETVTEGEAKVIVPKLEAYKEKPQDYSPSRAPVFYNPVMELNRDFAVLALQAYQRLLNRDLVVTEPLTGCGLRGVRFALEVTGIEQVVLNDIKPQSAELAKYNASVNGVDGKVTVCVEDANLFLSQHASPKNRFDYVDIDPFGPPVRYLDSAVRSLRNGGMLALTATDMAPLCGVYLKACVRKYGGLPLRTEYCHELAVRLLVGCLVMAAAKHEIGVEVVFSHSIDHYVRAYTRLNNGAKQTDQSVQEMGYISHCFSCFYRETTKGIAAPALRVCPSCGAKLGIAGPLWLGKIADHEFCAGMIDVLEQKMLRNKNRLNKILALVRDEADAPVTFYSVDQICDKLNLPIPPQKSVLDNLTEQSYLAVPTHFNSRGFRTTAPVELIKDVITKLATNR